ncbi:MAG: M15 family metallopeptidase, partial [Actinomycetota bacterium]|nr:M15 family metallopeptidase [Actinomycetota bacterium]
DDLTRYRRPFDWQRTLLDTTFRLERTYEPSDLVSTRRAGFAADFPVRRVVLRDLRSLRRAAARAGHPVEPTFAYRSFELQASVFQTWVDQVGRERALDVAARPGHSEHQLGTSVDFRSRAERSVDRAWGETPAGRWMQDNAPRFGFVLSYPRGAKARTCYTYEPWHFRYFGPERAADIVASGLTVREFLWREEAAAAPGG